MSKETDALEAEAAEAEALAAEVRAAAEAAKAAEKAEAEAAEVAELLEGPLVWLEGEAKPIRHEAGDEKLYRISVGGKNYEHVSERDFHGRLLWVYRGM